MELGNASSFTKRPGEHRLGRRYQTGGGESGVFVCLNMQGISPKGESGKSREEGKGERVEERKREEKGRKKLRGNKLLTMYFYDL